MVFILTGTGLTLAADVQHACRKLKPVKTRRIFPVKHDIMSDPAPVAFTPVVVPVT